MGVRIYMAVAIAWSGFSSDPALFPGEPAPDATVRDVAGAEIRLSAFREKKHVAWLALPQGHAAVDWAGTTPRLTALDTVVVTRQGAAQTVLIDRTGVVRRVLEGRVLNGAELETFVRVWQSGKGAFAAYCARCHGEDGQSVWCDPKPLTGLGRRLTHEQVRETLRMVEINDEVIIRGERIKKLEIDPIIVYVRSL